MTFTGSAVDVLACPRVQRATANGGVLGDLIQRATTGRGFLSIHGLVPQKKPLMASLMLIQQETDAADSTPRRPIALSGS